MFAIFFILDTFIYQILEPKKPTVELVKGIHDSSIEKGSNSIFECEFANLNTDTNVEWFHKGKPTTDIQKYNVSREGGKCYLQVFSCQDADVGDVQVSFFFEKSIIIAVVLRSQPRFPQRFTVISFKILGDNTFSHIFSSGIGLTMGT